MSGNPGWDLDLNWLNKTSVNAYCTYYKEIEIAKSYERLRGKYESAWLLKAVSFLDLTTLSGDDTRSNVARLSRKAANPISNNILEQLEFNSSPLTTAAVCVYPARVKDAKSAIEKLGSERAVPVAAVSAGFPTGLYSLSSRLQQIEDCIEDGAEEIDVVIDRSLILGGRWRTLYDELSIMKEKCKGATLKTILSVGELGNFRNVYKASLVAMMAGSDFIKTSTGKEAVNATFPVGLVMMRAIQDYYLTTTYKVGFKAAGGIRTAKDALNWLSLVKRELGLEWLNKSLFRIGASGLLNEIEKQLYFLAFNKIPASHELLLG